MPRVIADYGKQTTFNFLVITITAKMSVWEGVTYEAGGSKA